MFRSKNCPTVAVNGPSIRTFSLLEAFHQQSCARLGDYKGHGKSWVRGHNFFFMDHWQTSTDYVIVSRYCKPPAFSFGVVSLHSFTTHCFCKERCSPQRTVIQDTPQIVYKVVICPTGHLPYIQITFIVLPYSQSTNYLVGTDLSWRNLPYIQDHLYSATLYPVTL